ncbi:MAG TPA: hypothetical protein DC054_02205 [Blastocatellia bacterium]|nr:hypothetical protein [Blastocatellia bacterium]
MTHQEVEIWAREIVEAVLSNQPVEDARVELKSIWLDPRKTADRLAGHANAARGRPILWLIGVDEKNRTITGVDPVELGGWYKSVNSCFDGFAPRLSIDSNIRLESSTIVALYFETHQGAPFVVKGAKGGYPEFIVPWREGTELRAASRAQLLTILVPIRGFSALIDELSYNLEVVQKTPLISDLGRPFREVAFNDVMNDGALSALSNDERQLATNAYHEMKRSNQLVSAAINDNAVRFQTGDILNRAWQSVRACRQPIEAALTVLSRFGK